MAKANGTNGTNGTAAHPLPIVIAGGGCVGLFLALLLAEASVPQRIIVVEPEFPDPTSTRAMAHQPPTYPILARVPGLLPELMETGILSKGLCFRTSVAHGSRVIAGKTFDNNASDGLKGKGQLLLPQGKFQAVLLRRLARLPDRVEVRLGVKVERFHQTKDGVMVFVASAESATKHHDHNYQSGGEAKEGQGEKQDNQEEEQVLPASYLIGADGAHSTIRKHLGLAFTGETLDAQLVATDLYFDFGAHGFSDANFIVDATDYGLIGRIDNSGLWRVSYGVPSGQSAAQIEEGLRAKLAKLLPRGGKGADGAEAYTLVRVAPYKAQQRVAAAFWTGRVGLVGDAAHLTNPYAGLGLASGMADAASLGAVLGRVLRGEARDADVLLGAWAAARRDAFLMSVDGPSRIAYARVRTDVGSQEKVEAFLRSDELVKALKMGMPMMPPSLETKGEELEGW